MTLDTKLNYVATWDKRKAHDCWVTYHTKWENKYNGALFHALIDGTHNEYIEKELKTFKRYANMYLWRTSPKGFNDE